MSRPHGRFAAPSASSSGPCFPLASAARAVAGQRARRVTAWPAIATVFAAVLASTSAAAQGTAPAPEGAPADASPPPPPTPVAHPAPYSLPFQLRPVTAGTAIRSDTSFGSYENAAGQGGFAVVSELTGSVRVPGTGAAPGTGLAPLVKLTVVNDSPPGDATGGFAFVDPLVGASYGLVLAPGLRFNAFLGLTIPVGMGGGDTPDKGALDARSVGLVVRSAMDNALFAENDLTVIPGFDVAYVDHGFTAQLEATLLQLERVRGAEAQLEASKTNLTAGVHVGYFVADFLSLGAELRYQRWLNPPFAVQLSKPNTSWDEVTFGVGPRLHFKVSPGVWLRPGVSYSRGFDPPMSSPGNYNVVQLDVPVVF